MAIQWENLLAAIGGVGALGVAAYGVVEAFGKAVVWPATWPYGPWGLPYFGFAEVRRLAAKLAPALRLAYGDDYLQILAQQYRDGRGKGDAPGALKQGVRLALPFMSVVEATRLIDTVWGLGGRVGPGGVAPSEALARALVDEKAARLGGGGDPQADAVANEAAATLAGV